MDLVTPHIVSAVATAGGTTTSQYYISQAKFYYSLTSPFTLDVITDSAGDEQVFDLNFRSDEVVLVTLNETVSARWFRIAPTAANTYPSLTMELYGQPAGTCHLPQSSYRALQRTCGNQPLQTVGCVHLTMGYAVKC